MHGQDYCGAFVEQKGVSEKEAKAVFRRVTDMGREDGPNINSDIANSASKVDARRVLQHAREQGKDAEFFRRVYQAHFAQGDLISDHETIIRLEQEAGLDGAKVREIPSGDAYREKLEQNLSDARSLGATALPLFVINNKYAVSGAQPADSLQKA
ncbi:MAG: DsbA family protein [Eubacteriales bacterium]|nr:DsbA family protein [Eubacteriales bacterium]